MKFPQCHHYKQYYIELADFKGRVIICDYHSYYDPVYFISDHNWITNDCSQAKVFGNAEIAHKVIDSFV